MEGSGHQTDGAAEGCVEAGPEIWRQAGCSREEPMDDSHQYDSHAGKDGYKKNLGSEVAVGHSDRHFNDKGQA